MKKKDVLINIRGVYVYDEQDPDEIELFTTGTMHQEENGSYHIIYDESSATGYEGSTTTLMVEDNMVTMIRIGDSVSTHLIVQNGVRHQCIYDVGFGEMHIGVNGREVKSTLDSKGGDLVLKYSLDVNSVLASENEMFINVKERTADDR